MTQISPQALARRGIRLVLADLDNTLVPYKVEEPAAEVAAWARVAEPPGDKTVPVIPRMRPVATAQDMASLA